MVCNRCIEAVEEEFSKAEIPINSITLGQVNVGRALESNEKATLKEALLKRGFELLEDKNSQLIEQIKTATIDIIHRSEEPLKVNYSTYLERAIGRDYSYLSNLFSSVEGITIERYIILQKLERVKELLIYNELNLSQIAHDLGYSSVQYLSSQFKKSTGMSPSEFKKMQAPNRKPLDGLSS